MCGGSKRERLAAIGALSGLLLGATPSHAAEAAENDAPCVVHVMPSNVPGEWRRAGLELSHRVRQWPAPDRDCRELLVEITNGSAMLTITTKDGRRAQRLVATPSALVPAASALAVSVETTVPAASSPGAPTAEARSAEPQPPASGSGLVWLGGGLRMGAPGVFFAPVLRGAAALTVGAWEIGTFVDGAPQHWLAADDIPPRFTMWSFSSGINAGRREPLGALDLVAGMMFGACFVHQWSTTEELHDGKVEIDEEEGDGVDLQLGGYLGIATPRRANVRLRTQVEITLPLAHPGDTRELDSDLPPLPGWSLTGVVGVELGAP
ncbi:MAG TPA: hypothetical protein VK550_06845 [Polyangiaceae bacterium]|nr:hypothetical protein [Polyangiaceae bacterium]